MDGRFVGQQLFTDIADAFLGGDASDLTVSTPLVKIGVLDSCNILRLLTFAEHELVAALSAETVAAEDDFRQLSSERAA